MEDDAKIQHERAMKYLISTQVHEPMREWYNAYDQKSLRAKYGNFPKSPRVLARWSAYEPVATAFFDDAAPNSPH